MPEVFASGISSLSLATSAIPAADQRSGDTGIRLIRAKFGTRWCPDERDDVNNVPLSDVDHLEHVTGLLMEDVTPPVDGSGAIPLCDDGEASLLHEDERVRGMRVPPRRSARLYLDPKERRGAWFGLLDRQGIECPRP